jgi:hypothetical protein
MRIAGINYKPAYEGAYRKDPELRHKPYQDQLEALFKEGSVYANSFSAAMRALGNETVDIVDDHEFLQKFWATEHGVHFDPDHWRTDIQLAQIAHYRPDVVLFQDMYSMPHDVRRHLKRYCSFVKVVCMHKGFPGSVNELKDLDVMFAGIPTMVAEYRAGGLRARLLYHYFNDAILEVLAAEDPRPESVKDHEFVFLGSSGFGYGMHQSRFRMLAGLLERSTLEAYLHELDRPYPGTDTDPSLPRKPLAELYPGRSRPPLFGKTMYHALRRSKVSFNRHTDAARGDVGNMKMFETTGVGCLLLTDNGTNMRDLFEPGSEVVVYDGLEDCLEKVGFLLENDAQREAIARAGQRRTIRDHSTLRRCETVHEEINALLGN